MRLFANMLAGHITLKVFGGFVVMLLGAGAAYSALAPLPLLMTIAMTAMEVLVAFLQAYFTMLTCMYLNRNCTQDTSSDTSFGHLSIARAIIDGVSLVSIVSIPTGSRCPCGY